MQLIDLLEARADKVIIEETPEVVKAEYIDKHLGWALYLDGAYAPITDQAMDTLLNELRIPIKYVQRCIEKDGVFLAETNINMWLELYGKISFLTEYIEGYAEVPVITQVFPGKGLYIPAVRVNDLIIDYLGEDAKVESYSLERDIFNAVYLTGEELMLDGDPYELGVRVLYSDCFTITPRFDGVLRDKHFGALFGVPTTGRKFRVAGSTFPQIIEQVKDFLDISVEGLRTTLIPKMEEGYMPVPKINAGPFINRLCNDLRLNQKLRAELEKAVETHPSLEDTVMILASYTAESESPNIDLQIARDIQLALSKYIIDGGFK